MKNSCGMPLDMMLPMNSRTGPLSCEMNSRTGPLSCGSVYSDTTHTSVQDLYEPLSPVENMRSDYTDYMPFQASSPESSVEGVAADDVEAELVASPPGPRDLDFYRTLDLSDREEAAERHRDYLCEKSVRGAYPQINMDFDAESPTPYSDIAQPRKKSRPGSKPKRPMNAFMAFAQRERKSFMLVSSTMGNAIISKHLGQVWKGLSEDIRQPFNNFAKFLKDLHAREFPGYKYRPQKKKGSISGNSEDAAPPANAKPKAAAPKTKGRSRVRSRAKPYSRQPAVDQEEEVQQSASPAPTTLAQDHRIPLFPVVKQEVIELPPDLQLITLPTMGHASPRRIAVCRLSPAAVPISPAAAAIAAVSPAAPRVVATIMESAATSSILLHNSTEVSAGEPTMGGRHPWMSQTTPVGDVQQDARLSPAPASEMVAMMQQELDVAGVGGASGGEDKGELVADLRRSDYGNLPSLPFPQLECQDSFFGSDDASLVQGPVEVAEALDYHGDIPSDLGLDDPFAS